jgi:3-oxoacyl-[acyl-carrier protein] reductase
LIEQHPIRRLGTPRGRGNRRPVQFLASEASGWISGVILDVADGAVSG